MQRHAVELGEPVAALVLDSAGQLAHVAVPEKTLKVSAAHATQLLNVNVPPEHTTLAVPV